MIVRAIDTANDWVFGKGKESYKVNAQAVAQLCKTNLQNFLGDTFWATDTGVDWWNLLDKGQQVRLERALKSEILGTDGVAGLVSFEVLKEGRELTISYVINTIYSQTYRDSLNLQV